MLYMMFQDDFRYFYKEVGENDSAFFVAVVVFIVNDWLGSSISKTVQDTEQNL